MRLSIGAMATCAGLLIAVVSPYILLSAAYMLLPAAASKAQLAEAQLPNSQTDSAAEGEVIDDPQALLQEARKGWKHLEESFLHSHGTGLHVDEKHRSGSVTSKAAQIEFWTNEKWKRFDHRDEKSSKIVVYAMNSEYAFRAVASKPGDPFVITELEPFSQAYWSGAAQGHPGQIESMFHTFFREFVQSGWTLFGLPLDEIVRSDGFVLKSCRPTGTGSERRIEISCGWTAPHPDLPKCDNITLVVDPAMSYTLVRYRCDYGNDAVSLTATYRLIDGVPVPWLVSRKVTGAKNPSSYLESRFELSEINFTDYPEATFTTEAIGLPKPDEISIASTRSTRFNYLVAVNVAVVIALCWLVWRRYVNTKQA